MDTSQAAPGTPRGSCDSCGDVRDSLAPVHRIYVEYPTAEAEPTVTEVDELELWCDACTATYPHLRLS